MPYRGHRFAMAATDDDLFDETDYPDGDEDVEPEDDLDETDD